MFSKNVRRALVLGSVSSLAMAIQAQAAVTNNLSVTGYTAGATTCDVGFTFDVTGSINDTASGDQFNVFVVDGNGRNFGQRSGFVAVGTTQTETGTFSIPTSPVAVAPLEIRTRDPGIGMNRQLETERFDLAQMFAAGGACATIATNAGYSANNAPIANAGPNIVDRNYVSNSPITLDGSGSSDPDGDPLTYSWRQVQGPTGGVTLSNTTSAQATFQVSGISGPNQYQFELTVSDGTATSTSVVTVNLSPTATNNPPVANAGADQTVTAGNSVTLNGTNSSDPDNDPLTYSWVQTGGPAVTLANANTAQPTFTSGPTSATISYTFELTVTDPSGATSTDTVNITAVGGIIVTPNLAPNADAGANQSVARGDIVQLDASATTDPDGDPITYNWQQTGGAAVTLASPNSVSPSFTAPNVDRRGAVLTFEVTASDPTGATSTDTVDITIRFNAAPTPNAGPDQTAQGGTTVTLDGTASTDAEGDPITYSWGQSSGPSVTLVGDTTGMPTFVAPAATNVPQTLVFSLVVDDGVPQPPLTVVSIDQVTITIPAAPTNAAPIAVAGTDSRVNPQSTIFLDATDSTDPENDTLTYTWSQISGTPVTIADPNPASGQTSFVSPAQTGSDQVMVFEVAVSDGTSTSTDRVAYTVVANGAPTADAGTDQTVIGGRTVNFSFTGSSDPEGDPLTYSFMQISGPAARIDSAVGAGASITAPDPAATDQTLVFELTVSDGTSSATDTVTLTVLANTPPTADAGPDQTIRGGELVQLDGILSTDAEQAATMTYTWVQTGGPSVTLSDPTVIRPTFIAPTGLSATTPITFELTVDDGLVADVDTVAINVLPNSAPTADAGADIGPIDSGQTVTLNGSGSSDPDGDALTYSWTQTSGTSVTLSDTAVSTPSFTAPLVNGSETFEFQLSVSDGVFTRTDTVRVTVQALGTVTIVTNVIGADETVSFTTNVPGLASSVTTSGGTGTITAADVTAGSYSFAVNDLRAAGYALTGISCNDTDSSVSLQNGTAALELSPSESLVCTVDLTDTRTAAEQAIGEFLGGRNALLMANQPDLQRRLERLSGQSAGGGSAQIGQVAVPGSGALPANIRINSANRSISTSLAMVQTALGRREGQSDFDIWFEGSLADVTIGNNRGTFAIAYGGVDYLITPDVLIGALVQFDRFSNDADVLGAGQAEGDGWMAGPYITARLAPGFFVDARVAFGSSDNTVSSFGTYVDGFETDRMLASASAIGDIDLGEGLTFWPELSVRYLREDVAGYVDTLGVAIPDARIDQGEVAFSPRLDYRLEDENGWAYAPYGQIEGVLTFGADTYSVVENGLRARGSLGVDVVSPGNVRFGIAGFYDGIGEDRFEATGVTVTLSFGF